MDLPNIYHKYWPRFNPSYLHQLWSRFGVQGLRFMFLGVWMSDQGFGDGGLGLDLGFKVSGFGCMVYGLWSMV